MTETLREGREGSPLELPPPEPPTRSRARARARDTDSVAFQAVTQSARVLFRGGTSALAALDRAGSLRDVQPPTFRQDREWHHRCAGHYQAALVRWPRLLWGYAHLLLVKPVLEFAEWVTKSPARALVAAAVLTVIWIWRP